MMSGWDWYGIVYVDQPLVNNVFVALYHFFYNTINNWIIQPCWLLESVPKDMRKEKEWVHFTIMISIKSGWDWYDITYVQPILWIMFL